MAKRNCICFQVFCAFPRKTCLYFKVVLLFSLFVTWWVFANNNLRTNIILGGSFEANRKGIKNFCTSPSDGSIMQLGNNAETMVWLLHATFPSIELGQQHLQHLIANLLHVTWATRSYFKIALVYRDGKSLNATINACKVSFNFQFPIDLQFGSVEPSNE